MLTKKPNIVIVVPEQWRGDAVGCAGHPVVKTPNLDRLAEEGLYFSRAFTTNPICVPSRCSLLTGWYPHTRGHRTQRYLLGIDEPNLLRYLKSQGYTIGIFGKNDVLTAAALEASVDVASSADRGATVIRKPPYKLSDPRYYSFYWGKWDGTAKDHADNQIIARAFQFIDSAEKNRPYCLFLAFTFVHPPYFVDEPWYSMYSPDHVGHISPRSTSGKPRFVSLAQTYHRFDEVEEEHIRRIRAVYYGMISRTDDLIGKLVSYLKQKGQFDDTALFIVADHGNYAGDYGVPTKWWTGMEDALIRVPMAVRIPGQRSFGISAAMVQHIDVFATCLELAGVKPNWAHFGRSLVPLLKGETDKHREEVLAVSGSNPPFEQALDLDRASFIDLEDKTNLYYPWKCILAEHPDSASQTFMIRDNRWKYILRRYDVSELYDFENDPYEENNLLYSDPNSYKDKKEGMGNRLLDFLTSTIDVFPPIEVEDRHHLKLPNMNKPEYPGLPKG